METLRMVLMILGAVVPFTIMWMTMMYYMMDDWQDINLLYNKKTHFRTMPNNITYDQTDTRVNGTTEEVFDRLGKELTEEKFKLRQDSLRLLMANFGSSSPATAIYECAHEWCEKQYTTNGLANYFKAYYTGEKYK